MRCLPRLLTYGKPALRSFVRHRHGGHLRLCELKLSGGHDQLEHSDGPAPALLTIGAAREAHRPLYPGVLEQGLLGNLFDLLQVRRDRGICRRTHPAPAGCPRSSRSIIAATPGLAASANSSTAKLMRSVMPPPSIHSRPVCQPSTDGGFRISLAHGRHQLLVSSYVGLWEAVSAHHPDHSCDQLGRALHPA